MDFKKCGYQILDAFDRYNPFPSEEVKQRQETYGGSWANIRLPSISFVDRSWNWGSRKEKVYVHVSVGTQETAEEKEARQKREAEEHRNRLVMIVSGICSLVGAYFVGKQYQEYSHTDERFEDLEAFIVKYEICSSENQNSKIPTIRDIENVLSVYKGIYKQKLADMKTWFVLKTALFVEFTALCISAFYKKVPLRDGIGVITFVTAILTVLQYGLTYHIEDKWKKQIDGLHITIEDIRTEIFTEINTPPPYEDAVKQLEKTKFAEAGYSAPRRDSQNVAWIKHADTDVWLYWSTQGWIPTPNYVPQFINLG